MQTFAPSLSPTEKIIVRPFSIDLAQSAGTYDIISAVDHIWIRSAKVIVSNAASGLTSVSIQSNLPSTYVILTSAEGAAANLNLGRILPTSFTGPTILPQGRKLQYTISGTGTAGQLVLVVEYMNIYTDSDFA